MGKNYSFTIAMEPVDYTRLVMQLEQMGVLDVEREINYKGVRLDADYSTESKELTLTVLSKPMIVTAGVVEGKVRGWLRENGVKTA